MTREDVVGELVDRLAAARRVAIDGPDAAGKTTFADELTARLEVRVARGSIDDFLRPREERYRLGHESPEGYYADSFDHEGVRAFVAAVAADVLVFEGVFLFRPELNDLWDFRIYVACDEDVALRRAVERDVGLLGSVDAVRHRYAVRYQPAQRAYRERVSPESVADVVVDNTNLAEPTLIRTPSRFRSRV